MVELPKEVVDALRDSQTMKTLTTTDKEGLPHTVYKLSLTVLDDGLLGYLEMIERSRTYKNMLYHHWDKRKVAVSIYNPENGLAYQIKGIPTRCILEGPIWEMFRDQCWAMMPDAEPAAVWLISPDEVLNESYPARVEEETKRILQYRFWNTYPRKKKE